MLIKADPGRYTQKSKHLFIFSISSMKKKAKTNLKCKIFDEKCKHFSNYLDWHDANIRTLYTADQPNTERD